ncbi:PilW family protein [Variovorax paradoxus]|uniref:PilW family protein n=1 Tax=Variovorax paradoxus TaxID=34073 RepID=UPI003ECC265D
MIALSSRRRALRGLTLIELLVAMAVGLVVVLAAVSALTVARRGFTTVDAASQLRDNGRFAADMIQRIGVQTGYRDVFFAATPRQPTTTDPAPSIMGFNNAKVNLTNPLASSTTRPSTEAGTGSDILIMRYQSAQAHTMVVGSTDADKTMIDCAGNAPDTVANINTAAARDTLMASVFSVGINQGEPSLMCTYYDTATSAWLSSPIVQGVENFQVLYGVDGVTAGTATPSSAASPNVPNAYLRADQMTVSGNSAATNANWRRVRSVRIGMVLRSAKGAAQDSGTQTFYPFGPTKGSANGSAGSAFASVNDPGTVFQPTPDGRLRQTLTFTIHLRNDQGL